MIQDIKNKLIIFILFLLTLFCLGIFIYLFCDNIIIVVAVWISGLFCSYFADKTALYMDKFGYTNMKLGDYILLSRHNDETDMVERVVGEIISINDDNYSARVGKIKLKMNKKTLEIEADDNKVYKFFGVVSGM